MVVLLLPGSVLLGVRLDIVIKLYLNTTELAQILLFVSNLSKRKEMFVL